MVFLGGFLGGRGVTEEIAFGRGLGVCAFAGGGWAVEALPEPGGVVGVREGHGVWAVFEEV
jgi:hypothetical protein